MSDYSPREDPKLQGNWVLDIIDFRNKMYDLAASAGKTVPEFMLDELYMKGLDGDNPDEFPMLTHAFYKGKGNKEAMKKGWDVWLRCMKRYEKQDGPNPMDAFFDAMGVTFDNTYRKAINRLKNS